MVTSLSSAYISHPVVRRTVGKPEKKEPMRELATYQEAGRPAMPVLTSTEYREEWKLALPQLADIQFGVKILTKKERRPTQLVFWTKRFCTRWIFCYSPTATMEFLSRLRVTKASTKSPRR
jgi:hypothetical protein